MKVLNDLVGYENLKIYQDTDYFKFSLESVLLPNFITINLRTKNVLDLCTGNAPIPLILSNRTKAKIYGVEIQKKIYDLAAESVSLNKLNDQITILNSDVKDLDKLFPNNSFDIITVNPPYFKYSDASSINSNNEKSIARHEISLCLDDIIKIAKKLLKNNGILGMVHRTDRLIEVISILKTYNFEPKKIQFIHSKENSESDLFLIEARMNANPGLKILRPLIIHNNDNTYRDEINKIFMR
jgi:tRNA1(Val) A37 N6-methylase TrmN6